MKFELSKSLEDEELEEIDIDWNDFNSEYDEPVTETEKEFAENFQELLQNLIYTDESLDESFVNNIELQKHFYKHCVTNNNFKSNSQKILYDFTKMSEYNKYEKFVSNKVLTTKYQIPSLLDEEWISKCMRKLFEGDTAVLFLTSCGLKNIKGPVMLGFYAFSSDVSTNYNSQNAISLIVLSPKGKTITLFAIDGKTLQNKVLSIIKKFSVN